MADFTPELLERLDVEIAALTRHGRVQVSWSGKEVETVHGAHHVCAPSSSLCPKLVLLINAAPTLLANVRELAALRAEMEEWASELEGLGPGVGLFVAAEIRRRMKKALNVARKGSLDVHP